MLEEKNGEWFTKNVGTGKRSPRWHYDREGRRFIVYGTYARGDDALSENIANSGILVPSGYYCHVTNTIVDAQDGPTSFSDLRRSGRGY